MENLTQHMVLTSTRPPQQLSPIQEQETLFAGYCNCTFEKWRDGWKAARSICRGGGKRLWVEKAAHENGVSKKTKEKLVWVGIKKKADLKYLDGHEETKTAVSEASAIGGRSCTIPVVCKLVDLACASLDGTATETVDPCQG
eukprot:617440-Ditylum_brightwellii.AAC.1